MSLFERGPPFRAIYSRAKPVKRTLKYEASKMADTLQIRVYVRAAPVEGPEGNNGMKTVFSCKGYRTVNIPSLFR